MRRKSTSQCGIFNPRLLFGLALCGAGVFLAVLTLSANPPDKIATVATNLAANSFAASPKISGKREAVANGMPLAPADASWSIVPSPNVAAPQSLSSVTCVSTSDCWSVGGYVNVDGLFQTLTEHWNGTSWVIVTSPNNDATQDYLYDVACASGSDCWAVGSSTDDVNFHTETLIEHWNGASWTIVTSPNSGQDSYLNAVTCASASDCWAVGTLIEHWNGTVWSIVSSPNNGIPVDVTCTSSSNCWAVGSYYNGSAHQTFTEHWNGLSSHHPTEQDRTTCCKG